MGKACGHKNFTQMKLKRYTFFMHDSHDACPILFFFYTKIPIILTSITVASSKYFQMLDLVSYTNVE